MLEPQGIGTIGVYIYAFVIIYTTFTLLSVMPRPLPPLTDNLWRSMQAVLYGPVDILVLCHHADDRGAGLAVLHDGADVVRLAEDRAVVVHVRETHRQRGCGGEGERGRERERGGGERGKRERG